MHTKWKTERIYRQETHRHSRKAYILILRRWMIGSGQVRHGSTWMIGSGQMFKFPFG
jgi:hypothetical protein